MAIGAIVIAAALAAGARAELFEIKVVAQDGDQYRISSDHPARFLPDGTPELPIGSILSVVDSDGRDFNVLLAAPMSNDLSYVRHAWAQTLSRIGDYRMAFAQIDFSFAVSGPDSDGDGIPDEEDRCPFDNPMGRDADQDGCPDTVDRLPDLIERMRLEPTLKKELLFEARRANKAVSRGDQETARAFLTEAGAVATAAPDLAPRYRQILRDFIANCIAAL